MNTVPNTRCCDSAPHEPHPTTFAPATGIANGQCPGVPDFDCPEWCILDHAQDDARDDLILHQGNEFHPGERFAPTGDRLSIRVSRTDCPAEGSTGVPALAVSGELYLETWEQAAELAHAILDAFGYLQGA